ncbi:methylated-DNA--[protein]-cysteine S-methyltransferase [Methanobacterium aggregans]|uniref:methylated-DNA--[protein]-cysteine S-methyltransferase n=1 Tax=Methanobacterium aggregans TaxID=1615586 RepID=UPI001AE30D13|nr:MGMT family protein [Methanobacterium aggregans]MBP2047007.1 methylated-DNA-[protein]-cysteine S-methyltransferase [Methanobacterium aggregans]
MVKRHENSIEVSTYRSGRLHFAVGVSGRGKIVRIPLPGETEEEVLAEISKDYPNFELTDKYVDTAKTVSDAYHGEKVEFNLNRLDLGLDDSEFDESKHEDQTFENQDQTFENQDQISEPSPVKSSFERSVLLEVSKIPHGEVTTYKKISESLKTQGYRAVGTAIGKNPFPIIIPCHRVVKSDGSIGNYSGGVKMKREILKNEGVKIKGDKIILKLKKELPLNELPLH